MDNIAQYITFVKTQVAFHGKKAALFEARAAKAGTEALKADARNRAESHRRMEGQFEALLGFLVAAPELPARAPSSNGSKIRLAPDEIDGLPAELLEELSLSEADKADFAVLSVIEDAGGVLSLDKILVALYHKTKEVNKRTTLNARIYRMVQRGDLFNVPGKKGVYSLNELSEQEASQIS